MWHLLSMDCSGRHAQETLEVSIIRWLTSGGLLGTSNRANQDWLYLCCILYMLICIQMVIYTRLIQSIRVLSEYDYISVSWLLLHICHNFHFLERSGDPNVYLFHHDLTLMAWPLIWYYLIDLYMFIWVVTGQGPHQGHWALCCLWVRVMFITSIRVNLYIL